MQAIAGHASLLTTQMYANTRRDAAKRGAAALSEYYARQQKLGHQLGQSESHEVTTKESTNA